MNKKKKQKGFTIVELVIVIAVIGILAAVLIPTFSNLVKKAKQSSDQQLVYHINEAVVANEVDNLAKGKNGTEATMYDTLQKLDEYGFTIEKLTPRSDGDIVWDSVTNRFVLVNGTNIEYSDPNKPSNMDNKAQMWKIVGAGESLSDGYSHYLRADWEGVVPDVSTGLDVGDNDDITSVNYARTGDAQTVVIRTNSNLTTLTVDAPNDIVYHYDSVGSVNIISSDMASYHENGIVSFLEVAGGHVVLEETAKVSAVHFTATGTGETAKFENEDGKKISIDLSKVSDENMPSFSRDEVVIAENGTYVAEVTTDKSEYIWLFGNGIKEQMVTTEQAGAIAENGTLKTGITAGADDGSVAEQIANPAKRNSEGVLVDNNGDEIDVSSVNWSNSDALETITDIVYEELKTKEDAINENVIEYITTFEQLKDFVENGSKVNGTIGADFDITGQIAFNRRIVIDLNGYKLSNITTGSRPFNLFTFADVTINGTKDGSEISMPVSNISSYGLFFLKEDSRSAGTHGTYGYIGPSLVINGGTYTGTTDSGAMIKAANLRVSNLELYNVTMVTAGGGLIGSNGGVALSYVDSNNVRHHVSQNNMIIKNCNFTQGVADNGVIYNVGLSISGVFINAGLIENTTITSAHGCAIYASSGEVEIKNCNVTVLQPNNTANWLGAAIGVAADATVTIDGGNYQGQQYGLDVYTSNGHVIIKDGTFSGQTSLSVRHADNYTPSQGFAVPNIEVINGTFTGNLSEGIDAHLGIMGGTFNVDPTGHLVDGYVAHDNGNGTWTVVSQE